mmetsp:Transcript_107222/g.130827  ORF Transcript_107222/g.130827 Transcript_107222/m.130827 type:complete len:220 (+) Transcript_107222:65-724(+)
MPFPNIFELLTFPVIIYGSMFGAFKTYKVLSSKDDVKLENLLKFWIVFCGILFLFPFIENTIGFIMFSSFIYLAKLGLLFWIVFGSGKIDFAYTFIDDQIMAAIEPYMLQVIERTKDYRQTACEVVVMLVNGAHHGVITVLIGQMSDPKIGSLSKKIDDTKKVIRIEQDNREREDRKKSYQSVTGNPTDDDSSSKIGRLSNDGLRKRKNKNDDDVTNVD